MEHITNVRRVGKVQQNSTSSPEYVVLALSTTGDVLKSHWVAIPISILKLNNALVFVFSLQAIAMNVISRTQMMIANTPANIAPHEDGCILWNTTGLVTSKTNVKVPEAGYE